MSLTQLRKVKNYYLYSIKDFIINNDKIYIKKGVRNVSLKINCNNLLFELHNDLSNKNFPISEIYNEIKNLKKKLYFEREYECVDLFDSNQLRSNTKENIISLKSRDISTFGIHFHEVSIIENKEVIKKFFTIDKENFKFNKNRSFEVFPILIKDKIISNESSYCKILKPTNLHELLVVLILSKCIPVINKKWSLDIFLIDNNFEWRKALVIQDDIDYLNPKYFHNHLLSNYEMEEKIMYGEKLVSWNFQVPTSIAYNILTFLEKRYNGDVINKDIKANNLYSEDKEMFQKEKLKPLVIKKFTVTMITYKRINSLNYSLAQFNNNANVDKIVVIWNDPDLSKLPKKTEWNKSIAPVFFVKATHNTLHNKFLPYDIIKTEAILILDDDQRLTRPLLTNLYDLWEYNRDVLVGYNRRLTGGKNNSEYIYSGIKTFDLILTSLSFLNKKYLYYYTYNFSSKFKEEIDKLMNCEDIAMNYLVAMLSNKPNVALTVGDDLSSCDNCPASGLSTKSDHYKIRSKCVYELNNLFGINPMIKNKFFVNTFDK
uniref:Exostosin-3 (inferred by orthology to a D. melanogaster protein) n=1 Tax=Strongyloides venezuelensis TaxID=75913 RepID=A0A0K0FW20_STRVS